MPKIIDSHVAIGTIQTFGANSGITAGWLYCNGQAVSRTTYAALFAIVGTTWGIGDGSTTFNVPDMRGRTLRGRDHGAGVDPDAGTRSNINGGASGDNVGSVQGHATSATGLSNSTSSVSGSSSSDGSHSHSASASSSSISGSTSTDGNHAHSHDPTFNGVVNSPTGSGAVFDASAAGITVNQYAVGATGAAGSHNHSISGTAAAQSISVGSAGTHSHTISGTAAAQSISSSASETRMKNANVAFYIKF